MRVFGICGKSKGGRSELVSELVGRFRMEGLRVAIVKRAPMSFDLDTEGTDSYRQRESGCAQMLISSDRRFALMEEYPADSASPELDDLVARLKPADIVLAINFRDAAIPRIEVCDAAADVTPEVRNPRWVVGRIGRVADLGDGNCLAPDAFDAIAEFVLERAKALGEDRSDSRERSLTIR
jgi:molybdopterin-guanine dinucleotide biosynthesis protein B